MSRSRHARMIRTAISPRLAISTRRNGGPSLRKDVVRVRAAAASERDVAMLLSWVRVALVRQQLERRDEAGSRLGRTDHRVDVAARRRCIGARELGPVLLD